MVRRRAAQAARPRAGRRRARAVPHAVTGCADCSVEEKEEIAQEEKERQLRELSDSTGVHSSQAKIKVIGING